MLNNILDMMIGGVRLNTRVDNMDTKSIRRVVKYTTKYCVDTFGINKRKRTEFVVSIIKQRGGVKSFGMYSADDNKITIHHNNCPTLKDLIQTTIHEYTHYKQPVKSSYEKLLKKYGYNDHPMEIQAREMENKYYKDCWNKIKNQI